MKRPAFIVPRVLDLAAGIYLYRRTGRVVLVAIGRHSHWLDEHEIGASDDVETIAREMAQTIAMYDRPRRGWLRLER